MKSIKVNKSLMYPKDDLDDDALKSFIKQYGASSRKSYYDALKRQQEVLAMLDNGREIS